MTQRERLKEIESHTQGTIPTDIWDDHQWLINRVKRLTDTLEDIHGNFDHDSDSHEYDTTCRCCLAYSILEEEC